jgi:hypothetical protein
VIDETHILKVEKDSHDGLIVTFSDGTTAGYVVEELLSLRPHRELTHEPGEHKPPPKPLNAELSHGRLLAEATSHSEVPEHGNGRERRSESS